MNKDIMIFYPQFGDSATGYTVSVKDATITVKPRNMFGTAPWTEQGLNNKLSLINTGNGVKINISGKKINLDYSEAEELSLLLTLHQKIDNQEFVIKEVSVKDLELK